MVDIRKSTDNIVAKISLPSIKDVKEFVGIAENHNCSVSLQSGRYVVDGKSIMGVFSLDLSKPLDLALEVGANGIDDRDDFMTAVKRFTTI